MRTKNLYVQIALLACVLGFAFNANAQQVNTHYFLENSPLRHQYNPAFQPVADTYIGIPVLGYLQMCVTSNAFSLQDFVFNQNGETVTFLHPSGDVNKFFNALRPTSAVFTDLRINLINFGFRSGDDSYWTFGISERMDGGIGLPKDMFSLLLFGTPNIDGVNLFNLKTLGVNATLYTEAALGYSRILNDKWTVGGKAKFLYGTANFSIYNQNLDLNASMDNWLLKGEGIARISSPYATKVGENLNNVDFTAPEDAGAWLKPSGFGFGFDLGAAYKPIEQLTLSASLVDVGFIFWSGNVQSVNYNVDYTFEGMGEIKGNGNDITVGELFDSIKNAFLDASTTDVSSNTYISSTTAKLNIGAEYAFLDNKLSAGLLSRTMLFNSKLYEELTISANGRPTDWFNASLSYSVLNGKFSSVGLGVGIATGPLHWLVSADYVPFEYARYNSVPIPYKTKGVNFAVGLNIALGGRDQDKDGVKDRKDLCPDTPRGVIVDENGCPIDTDGDGVPDYLDRCPDTPQEARGYVDSNGCPLDTDGDGVPDYLDKCPDTPAEAYGYVDSNGCPLDSDGDGIPDYLDKCPDTPVAARGYVDSNGCPFDSDGDGVPDYLDKCPDTPAAAYGRIDSNGCPLDSDSDGVPDYLDKCPETPKEARGFVGKDGCPLDSDGDGVPDYLDKCPKTPGTKANNGCPEVKTEVRQLLQKALRGIQFDLNKATIKKVSYPILDEIVKVMSENPTYKLIIKGHTDSSGKADYNLALSKDRANAVADYLIQKGISPLRLTSEGYGDTMPVATNQNAKGRALNRRVEFIVEFIEVTYE